MYKQTLYKIVEPIKDHLIKSFNNDIKQNDPIEICLGRSASRLEPLARLWNP